METPKEHPYPFSSLYWSIEGSDGEGHLQYQLLGNDRDMSRVLDALMHSRQDLTSWRVHYKFRHPLTTTDRQAWFLLKEMEQHQHHSDWSMKGPRPA